MTDWNSYSSVFGDCCLKMAWPPEDSLLAAQENESDYGFADIECDPSWMHETPIPGIPASHEKVPCHFEDCLNNYLEICKTKTPQKKMKRVKKLCEICSKEVFQLRKHNLIHEGAKRHVCSFCERRFVQKSNLNRHVRDVHRSACVPLRFGCSLCSYETNRSDKFKSHTKSHKDKK